MYKPRKINKTKQEYLKRYKNIYIEIMTIQDMIDDLNGIKGVIYDDMPKAKTAKKAKEDKLIEFIDKQHDKIHELFVAGEEIIKKIEKLKKPDEQEVLMWRYIRIDKKRPSLTYKYEYIADKMGYSTVRIKQIHAQAINNLEIL